MISRIINPNASRIYDANMLVKITGCIYLKEQSRPCVSNVTSADVSFVLRRHWLTTRNLSKIRNGLAPEMVQ